MGNLSDLAKSMENLAVRVEKGGPGAQRKVAAEILRLVVMGTPVGNKAIWIHPEKAPVGYVGGRARANWFVGLGAANTQMTEGHDGSGSATINTGVGVIGGSAPQQDIHICNNLEYIQPLNRGHSHQAPAGWIETAILAGQEILKQTKVTEGGK